jgi:tRNA pseudouridine38-40 synthase
MSTRRIKLTVEYDGTDFHGWQRQKVHTSVQGAIEAAVLKLTQQHIKLYAAGRTDAGVHGLAQVCHFDIDCQHPLVAFKEGINRFTPETISILKAEVVTDNFHARFSAKARSYEFWILNRRTPSALYRNRAVHVHYALDIPLMEKALQSLLGVHDFSAFRSSECESSVPICDMQKISVRQDGELIKFNIQANHFLHNMIRITLGTAVDISRGHIPADTFSTMLRNKERNSGGITLPPQGLYFKEVIYDENDFEVLESTDA